MDQGEDQMDYYPRNFTDQNSEQSSYYYNLKINKNKTSP